MQNRESMLPGRVKITPEDGSAPYYVKIEMADEPTVVGTPLDRDNLLSEAVATKLGINPVTGTPSEAFEALKTNVDNNKSELQVQIDQNKTDIRLGLKLEVLKREGTGAVGGIDGKGSYTVTFQHVPKMIFVTDAPRETFFAGFTPQHTTVGFTEQVTLGGEITGELNFQGKSLTVTAVFIPGSGNNYYSCFDNPGVTYYWYILY